MLYDISRGLYYDKEKMERVEKERDEFLIGQLEQAFLKTQAEGSPLYFSKLQHSMLRMSVALVSALNRDIQKHRITMYYQPQVDKNGRMIGVEALLRWDYQGRKILPPLVIALAKENQIINELSIEILEKSASDMKEQIQNNPEFKLSVNVVAEQIDDKTYSMEFLSRAEEKKEVLQNLGCDYFQGFLFSPAVPAEKLDRWGDTNDEEAIGYHSNDNLFIV